MVKERPRFSIGNIVRSGGFGSSVPKTSGDSSAGKAGASATARVRRRGGGGGGSRRSSTKLEKVAPPQPQWKQVGKSSVGTPIYERKLGDKTYRVATSNIKSYKGQGLTNPGAERIKTISGKSSGNVLRARQLYASPQKQQTKRLITSKKTSENKNGNASKYLRSNRLYSGLDRVSRVNNTSRNSSIQRNNQTRPVRKPQQRISSKNLTSEKKIIVNTVTLPKNSSSYGVYFGEKSEKKAQKKEHYRAAGYGFLQTGAEFFGGIYSTARDSNTISGYKTIKAYAKSPRGQAQLATLKDVGRKTLKNVRSPTDQFLAASKRSNQLTNKLVLSPKQTLGQAKAGLKTAQFGTRMTLQGAKKYSKKGYETVMQEGSKVGEYAKRNPGGAFAQGAAFVASWYGPNLVARGASKLAKPLRSKAMKVTLEGVTTQKGKVLTTQKGVKASSLGTFEGKATVQPEYFRIKPKGTFQYPTLQKKIVFKGSKKGKARWGNKYSIEFKDFKRQPELVFVGKEQKVKGITAQAQYSGTPQRYDVGYQAQIPTPKGENLFTGRGRGVVSGSKGAEIYEILGKEAGKKKLSYSKGLRGYTVKLGEGVGSSVTQAGQTVTTKTQPFFISSVSKQTSKLKSPKKAERFFGSTEAELKYEFGKRGSFMESSDYGIFSSKTKNPLVVKGKSTDVLEFTNPQGKKYFKKFTTKVEKPLPGTSKEKFHRLGTSFSSSSSKTSSAKANKMLGELLPQEKRVSSSAFLGVGLPAPEVRVLQKKALKPASSFGLQSGLSARQFAEQSVKSSVLSQSSKGGTLNPLGSLSFFDSKESPSVTNQVSFLVGDRSKVSSASIIKQAQKSRTRSQTDSVVRLLSSGATKSRSKVKQKPANKVATEFVSGLKPVTRTKPTTRLRQVTQSRGLPKQGPSQSPFLEYTYRPPRTKIPPFPMEKRRSGRAEKGFNVFVRSRGKWLKLSDKALSRSSALSFGARAVEGSSAATFSIRSAGKRVRSKSKGTNYFLKAQGRFRSKKGGGKNTFVEKSKYRINTAGELTGITAKGWAAKRKRKNLFGFGKRRPSTLRSFL